MQNCFKKDMEQQSYVDNKKLYDTYYERVLLKEEPFYKEGMSKVEIQEEIKYLNENLDSFYKGTYLPLWKQNLKDNQ